MNTTQLIALFLAELGFGSAIVFPLMPMRVAGKSFLRFYYGLIIVFIALFLTCLYRMDVFNRNYALASALGLWIWALSFTHNFTKLEESLTWVFAAVSLGVLALFTNQFVLHGTDFITAIPSFLLVICGAVFLSFHLMNMIFGHWYLVNRNLPISHLIRTCKLLIGVSWARAFSVAAAIWYAHKTMDVEKFSRLTDFMGHGIFFWARVLCGLGLPLLVSHLAYSSAKIGSNQSATGIMYAGVVFVLMGEIMAVYLYAVTGWLF